MSGCLRNRYSRISARFGSCWTLEHACMASSILGDEMCENGLGLHSYEIRVSARPG